MGDNGGDSEWCHNDDGDYDVNEGKDAAVMIDDSDCGGGGGGGDDPHLVIPRDIFP